MGKLPLGECPGCKHPLWDNDADLKGRTLEQVRIVCIYCGVALHYDLLAGKWAKVDVGALPLSEQREIRNAQLLRVLMGPDALMGDELRRRNRDKKTS